VIKYQRPSDDWPLTGEFADNRNHMVPLNDLREHETGCDCWCKPYLNDDGDMYIHRALDMRNVFYPEAADKGFYSN